MAVNRETIEILVQGGDRIRTLRNQIEELSSVAIDLEIAINSAGQAIKDLKSGNIENALTRVRRLRGEQQEIRTAMRTPETFSGTGAAASGMKRLLQEREKRINAQMKGMLPQVRAVVSDIRELQNESSKLGGIRGKLSRQRASLGSALEDEERAVRESASEIRQDIRRRRDNSFSRTTASRISRLEAEANRLGSGQGMAPDVRQRASAAQGKISGLLSEISTVKEFINALKKTLPLLEDPGGRETASRQIRQAEGTLRQFSTELRSTVQELRETTRVGRGRSSIARSNQSIEQRMRLLEERGVPASKFVVGTGGGKQKAVSTVLGQASQLANRGNNIQGARDLTKLAAQRITFLERELNTNEKIERLREKGTRESEKRLAIESKINQGKRLTPQEARQWIGGPPGSTPVGGRQQLVLPPAAPGSPQMSGGARRIGSSREFLVGPGGARTYIPRLEREIISSLLPFDRPVKPRPGAAKASSSEIRNSIRDIESATQVAKDSFDTLAKQRITPPTYGDLESFIDGLGKTQKLYEGLNKLNESDTREWDRKFMAATALRDAGLPKILKDIREARTASSDLLGKLTPAEGIDKIVREARIGKPVADNLTTSFSSQISGNARGMSAAASAAFEGVKKSIKKVWGIASPSRFMIEVAQNLANTFIRELESAAPRIKATTAKVFGEQQALRNVKSLRATTSGFAEVESPSTGFRPLPMANPGAAFSEEFTNMSNIKRQIALLTTQPDVYQGLLNAIPDKRITTDIIGVANRRAMASEEIPSFMQNQRLLGPGELEKYISRVLSGYLRDVRVPNPWVGPIGDYKNFIASIKQQTGQLSEQKLLSPAKTPLALPPSLFASGLAPSAELRRQAALRRSLDREQSVRLEDAARMGSAAGVPAGIPSIGPAGARPAGPPPPPPPSASAAAGRPQGSGPRNYQDTLMGLSQLPRTQTLSTGEIRALSEGFGRLRDSLDPTIRGFRQLDEGLRNTVAGYERELERRDPRADFLTRRLGPRGAQAASEGLIGGAFPLLFGQGPGASMGGLLGGTLGGFAGGMLGFGASLIGTAIGQAVDDLIAASVKAGDAMRDFVGNFDQIKSMSLMASRGQEKLVSTLIDSGRVSTAYGIIQDQLNRKIGAEGMESLVNVSNSSDRLSRAMADLGKQLEVFIAGPASSFMDLVSTGIERVNLEARVQRGLAGATPQARKAAKAMLSEGAQKNQIAVTEIFNPRAYQQKATEQDQLLSRVALFLEKSAPKRVVDEKTRLQNAANSSREALSNQQELIKINDLAAEAADIPKNLRQQVISAAREQQDTEKQSAELRRKYEKDIGDIRRGVSEKAAQLNQENLKKEIEVISKQGEIREQQFRNIAATLQGRLAGDALAQSLANAVNTYLSAQLSAQNQIEQQRLQFEFEVSSQQIETEKYKLEVARNVARLNEETAREVENINLRISRRNEDMQQSGFAAQKKSAELRLLAIKAEADLLAQQNAMNLFETRQAIRSYGATPNLRDAYTVFATAEEKLKEISDSYSSQKGLLDAIAPPPLTLPIQGPRQSGVSTTAVDMQLRRGGELDRRRLQGRMDVLGSLQEGNLIELKNQLDQIAFADARQQIDDLNKAFEENESVLGRSDFAIKQINKSYEVYLQTLRGDGRLTEEQKRTTADLLKTYQQYHTLLRELAPTIKFYSNTIREQSQELDRLNSSISEIMGPGGPMAQQLKMTRMLERSGGIGVDESTRKSILDGAKNIDLLNQKLRMLDRIKTAASGWTDSFINFNKQLLTTGNLMESVRGWAQDIASKASDLVLEMTLRPLQEEIFKDLADFFGFKMPEDPTLKPLNDINGLMAEATQKVTEILAELQKQKLPAQVAPVPAAVPAANNIVPTSLTPPVSFPEYIDKSVLRTWLQKQGFGRTTGDFTNAGHRTPNHILNAMDMGILGGSDAEALRKTSEMEKKLRATGAFGSQLFGPISDPYGHGAGKGGQNIHLHIPTPGGRVKLNQSLADLMGIASAPQPSAAQPIPIVPFAEAQNNIVPLSPGASAPASPLDQATQEINRFSEALSSASVSFDARLGGESLDSLTGGIGQRLGKNTMSDIDRGAFSGLWDELNTGVTDAAISAEKFSMSTSLLTREEEKRISMLQRFGDALGEGIKVIGSASMIIGGVESIRKGGTYNTLSGLSSLFGGVAGITRSAFGWFGGRSSPGFASGGRPGTARNSSVPSKVGENGPELWWPDQAGTIIPMDDVYIPGVTTNRKAGAVDEATVFRSTRESVAKQRAAARERARQSDSGNTGASATLNHNYSVTEINSVRYVTEEEYRKGLAESGKASQKATMQAIKNSGRVRQMLGLPS